MITAMLWRPANRRGLLAAPRVFNGVIFGLLALCLTPYANTARAQPPTLQTYLQQRFHLSEPQVRGALGALLVYAQQRLQKSDFDDLVAHVPNAEHAMQVVKQQGIVTGPLDDIDEYEKTLSNVGIAQPLASQFAPAVIEWLGAAGYSYERDILMGIIR
jgi:hypothetical protein